MSILKLHREPLVDDWLDAYGHLNEAYYLVPFSNANWAMQEYFGIGIPYFEATGCALYTVETHLRYLDEVRQPALLEIESMVFGGDHKRLWWAHSMVVDGRVRATGEFMILHYSTREKRVIPMPDEVYERLMAARMDPLPDWVNLRTGDRRQRTED